MSGRNPVSVGKRSSLSSRVATQRFPANQPLPIMQPA